MATFVILITIYFICHNLFYMTIVIFSFVNNFKLTTMSLVYRFGRKLLVMHVCYVLPFIFSFWHVNNRNGKKFNISQLITGLLFSMKYHFLQKVAEFIYTYTTCDQNLTVILNFSKKCIFIYQSIYLVPCEATRKQVKVLIFS